MLNLDSRAQQLLSFAQQQTSRMDHTTEQAIQKAAESSQKPLTPEKVSELLQQAMPAHKDKISALGKKLAAFQCESKPSFVSQIVGKHTIEKDRAAVYQAPHIVRPTRDPLSAQLIMAKDADVMLLFNGGVFDDAGRPLLLKIVAREKMKDKLPDISNYHTLSKTPDVQLVADNAAYVTIKDVDEAEFAFGHPLAQVSLDCKGNELSRSGSVHPNNSRTTTYYYGMNQNGVTVPNLASPVGWTPTVESGAQLDTTGVQTFRDRVQLEMSAKADFPKGGWLDTPLKHVEAKLMVEPGYMLEPDSFATVSYYGAQVETKVPADDFSFIGSPSGEAKLQTENAGGTIGALLNQSVTETTHTGGGSADQITRNTAAYALIYQHAAHIKVAGTALDPLGDAMLTKEQAAAAGINAFVQPLSGDKDGQEVHLELPKGFLSAEQPGTVEGWKMVVGFATGDAENPWIEAKPRLVGSDCASGKESFKLSLDDAPAAILNDRNLEIRLFNERGVPAERVLIPFKELPWGPGGSC
ncbi:MAG: hypothetical protein U1E65_21480 [Myxococcota bacterium]